MKYAQIIHQWLAVFVGLGPILEKGLDLMPFVNPMIKEDLWGVATLLSIILGFGCHTVIHLALRHIPKSQPVGIFPILTFFALSIIAVCALILMIGISYKLEILSIASGSFLMRSAYIVFFISLSMSLGTALALRRHQ